MVVIADRGLHPCGAAVNPCRVDGAAGGFGDAGPVAVHGAVVQVGVGAVPQHGAEAGVSAGGSALWGLGVLPERGHTGRRHTSRPDVVKPFHALCYFTLSR